LRLAVAGAIVIGLSVAAVTLYNAYGRPADERSEIVVAPAATLVTAPTTAASLSASTASVTPVADPPFSADLLRPGVEELSRFEVALDGSPKRLVAVSTRFTATDGCGRRFAELFALREHRWTRVFDASAADAPSGTLLPSPERSGAGCFPELRLFTGVPADGRDLLAVGVAYADGSVRLLVLGWDADNDAPKPLYDRLSGPGGRIARLGDDRRIELSEDLAGPPGTAGPIGRLSEIVSTGTDGIQVARRIAPNCDRGRLSAGSTAAGATVADPRLLLLDCSNGAHALAAIADSTVLSPVGVAWEQLRDGDSVQVEYAAASLQPGSADGALPLAANITDYAANTRRLNAERPARPAATAPRAAAPAAPQRNAPSSLAPPAGGGSQSGGGSSAGDAPRPAATRAPRSSGPPGAPMPAITPPPPPRNPPYAGPPPAPPGP
jgi:hypothetical protein